MRTKDLKGGVRLIGTALNYATGQAQTLLAPALAAHPSLRIATKAGYFTAATGADALNAGVLTEDQAMVGHSLTPDYVRWQMGRNREQLGRERLDPLSVVAESSASYRAAGPAAPRPAQCVSAGTWRSIKAAREAMRPAATRDPTAADTWAGTEAPEGQARARPWARPGPEAPAETAAPGEEADTTDPSGFPAPPRPACRPPGPSASWRASDTPRAPIPCRGSSSRPSPGGDTVTLVTSSTSRRGAR